MANRTVKLILRAKVVNPQTGVAAWRRFPAAVAANGKPRQGFALVQGVPTAFQTYQYQLRSYDGPRIIYVPQDTSAAQAMAALKMEQRKRALIGEARALGATVTGTQFSRPLSRPGSPAASGACPASERLDRAAERYLARAEAANRLEGEKSYRVAIADFLSITGIRFVDQASEDAMLAYQRGLRAKGNSERTIHNKFASVKGFLVWAGAEGKSLGKKPTYDKKKVVVYSDREVNSLIDATGSPEQKIVWQVLLMTGMREAEAQHLMWSDLAGGVIRVENKPELGFRVKDREERDIALSPQLIELLDRWKQTQAALGRPNPHRLVLPSRSGAVNRKWLLALKRAAKRAGLNCGRCKGCRNPERRECHRFTLHAFRRTFATKLARAGFDLVTIMDQLGHADVKTTMNYLAGMKVDQAKRLMQKVSWTNAA